MPGRRSFMEYCQEHGIEPAEYGPAFAAYLNEITSGEWDGDVERVDDES